MVLIWRIKDDLPNLPNFLPAKLSCYMVMPLFYVESVNQNLFTEVEEAALHW